MPKDTSTNYAVYYPTQEQATNGARALFAEVYERLKNLGYKLEVAQFNGQTYECMQFATVDGVRNLPRFGTSSGDYDYGRSSRYYIKVNYEPSYTTRHKGFSNVERNPKRAKNAMTPASIVTFFLKYIVAEKEAMKHQAERDAAEKVEEKKRALTKAAVDRLKARPNPGEAYIHADTYSRKEDMIQISIHCNEEEALKLLTVMDVQFPKKKIL